uniref:Uncharacterized protein n=1 Tax=Arundo donax TaxID=35708 RepID=A0A0A9CSE7_ARUDO
MKGALVLLRNPRICCSCGTVSGWNAPVDGGSDCASTAMVLTVENLMPAAPSPAARAAARRFCIAGRSAAARVASPDSSTSLPTATTEMVVARTKGSTLAASQRDAAAGSAASPGMSPLATPTTTEMLEPASARMSPASTPYRRTLEIAVDLSSFAVSSGDGRLSATSP